MDTGTTTIQQQPWAMADSQLSADIPALYAQEQALAARRLALIAEAHGRDLPRRSGATCTASWLRGLLNVSVHTARRMVEVSKAIDGTDIATAMTDGDLNEAQALVIVRALAALAGHADTAQIGKAQAMLLGFARDLDPEPLATAGKHILETVAPDVAAKRLADDLANAEARATRDRTLSLTPDGTGRTRITGLLGEEAAGIVRAALDPLSSPAGPDDDRTAGQRRADALVDICTRVMASDTLPDNGGDDTHFTVTMRFEDLRDAAGAGTLDNGQSLSPEAARRKACDATIIPAVFNSAGQLLDLGRARRLFTGPLRRALILRDRGCAFPGCDRPAAWCHGHHLISWINGGPTNLDNAVLLCGHHHRVIHQGEWEARLGQDRLPEFIPPYWIDPQRKPRRNHLHRRP